MKKFVISAGHAKSVSGATGNGLKEHEECKKIASRVYDILVSKYSGTGKLYIDNTAVNQQTNLTNVIHFHNSQERHLDVFVHLNSAGASARGSEVWFTETQSKALAENFSKAMSNGLLTINRGSKVTNNLAVLNGVRNGKGGTRKAVLLECFFLSNKQDVTQYKAQFEKLCQNIALTMATELGYKISDVKPTTHKVVKGDTLYNIALRYNTTVEKVQRKNLMESSTVIKIGQTLKI